MHTAKISPTIAAPVAAPVAAPISAPASRFYLACQAGGWGLWVIVYASITAAYVPHTPSALFQLFCSYLLNGLYGVLVSHLLYRRMAAWMELGTPRILLHVVPAVALGALIMTLGLVLVNDRLLHIMGGRVGWREALIFYANLGVLLTAWTIIYAVIRLARGRRAAERRQAELEVAIRDAQFRSLAAQVQPHFFFNALNTIRGLIYENPAEADRAITELAALLRAGLQDTQRKEIPLREELLVVRNYLSLERLRFEHRLSVAIHAPEELQQTLLPSMCLQHLVENALKHGIARLPGGGTVAIDARRFDDTLEITVSNPVPSNTTNNCSDSGHGLANTRERLRLLYGVRAGLELLPSADTVTARLTLPFRPAPAEDIAHARLAD